ncbi:MoaD/ThiS family protein [Patescibacteria group bacterium]|nr:MoaD/ThiS family protein [Patescibacteria group bacterium]
MPAVEIEGTTIKEVINNLIGKFPTLQPLLTRDGKLGRNVNVFLESEDIRFLNHEETLVKPTDEIHLVPAVAGG